MRTLLNLVRLVLCGIWVALGYALAGLICCVLIVTIPFGLAAFRMANFALVPVSLLPLGRVTSIAGCSSPFVTFRHRRGSPPPRSGTPFCGHPGRRPT